MSWRCQMSRSILSSFCSWLKQHDPSSSRVAWTAWCNNLYDIVTGSGTFTLSIQTEPQSDGLVLACWAPLSVSLRDFALKISKFISKQCPPCIAQICTAIMTSQKMLSPVFHKRVGRANLDHDLGPWASSSISLRCHAASKRKWNH